MTRASLASEVRFTRECFWKVRECKRSHTRVFRECERYNSRVRGSDDESREHRARRRERGASSEDESTVLGEDSAGPARRKSTEARRREHGSMSSETESAEARRARAKQRGRAMVTRAGPPARDVSTYRGARWAVARERSTRASSTRK